MGLLRANRLYAQVEAELERWVLADTAGEEATEEVAITPPKKGLADRTVIL